MMNRRTGIIITKILELQSYNDLLRFRNSKVIFINILDCS